MIYSIVGENKEKRDMAFAELKKLGSVSRHIYIEHLDEVESLIDGVSLFGEKSIVHLLQLMDTAKGKDELVRLFPEMKESPNIFIVDEPFGDANRVARLSKISEKLYDARNEKKKDTSVFGLCMSFARRDKKTTWSDWMKIKEKETPEAIQGALWWKWRDVWQDTLSGKKTAYTIEECERIGKELVEASILAHRGEKDLGIEIERILLSI